MPKYIYGKDFHKNIGKTILMPHPMNAETPIKLKIIEVKNKLVTLQMVGTDVKKATNYSKDKTKYLVIE